MFFLDIVLRWLSVSQAEDRNGFQFCSPLLWGYRTSASSSIIALTHCAIFCTCWISCILWCKILFVTFLILICHQPNCFKVQVKPASCMRLFHSRTVLRLCSWHYYLREMLKLFIYLHFTSLALYKLCKISPITLLYICVFILWWRN